MAAQLRIDQVTPGIGIAGRSRHDLVPNEIITLVATSPAPGTGITFSWELLDKRGTAAVLSGTSGVSVTIGPNVDITRPTACLIELTVNDNGNITKDRRIASVRTLNAGLRVPVFPETAPESANLALNDPTLSTDNALYPDRSGTGVAEQNPFGWSEWAWEVVQAVDALAGGGAGITELTGDVLAGPGVGPEAATVVALQGVDLSAAAPAGGDLLTYNGGTLKWEPAPPSGGSAVANTFVYRQGGVAAGNVYTTWATLYAAVSLVEGPVVVEIDDTAGVPEVSAGAYDFDTWTLVGKYDVTTGARPNLLIRTAVTITGNFRAERLVITLDTGASTPIVYAGSSTRIFEFVDTMIDGAAGNGIFSAGALGAGLRFILRGNSRMLSTAVLLTGTGTARIEAHDQTQVDGDAVAGTAGTYTLLLVDPDSVTYIATGFSGTFTLLNPTEVFNGPLNAEQLGTTELHIGSVYLRNGTRVLGDSLAMLGASLPADEGFLLMRQFTGGGIIMSWTQAGLLASVTSPDGDISIIADDWYDLYLYAGGAAETAIIKGLRLLVVLDSMPV